MAPTVPELPRLARTVADRFKKAPLRGFRDHVIVVCSSLYPLILQKDNQMFDIPVAKLNLSGRPFDEIYAPNPLTGVMDGLAMAQIGAWLTKRKKTFELRIDATIEDNERRENDLILVGGPTSNLLTRDVVVRINQDVFSWDGTGRYANLILNRITPFTGGNHGVAIRDRNPWNTQRRVLVVGGLGPHGTAAAVDFVINQFEEKAGNNIKNAEWWVAITSAAGPPAAPLSSTYLGGEPL